MRKTNIEHLPTVAFIDGLRTPFAKQGTDLRNLTALDLGKIAVNELVQRSGIHPEIVEQVVYGQVIPSLDAPNIAREIVLGTTLPNNTDAFSVSRACATSYQSVANIAESMMAESIECGIAGGADSASDIPMTVSKKLSQALMKMSKAKTFGQKLGSFQGLSVKDIAPVPPALRELSTGLTMGESAEKMAKENQISRADQDAFAHRSHTSAAKAYEAGYFKDQIATTYGAPSFKPIVKDNLVRTDSDLAAYAKLKPVFDRKHGTVTAGTSSPLTDGASAILLMRKDRAEAEGLPIMGTLKSYAFAALNPHEQLLMGPAYATPIALERAGLDLQDVDLIDMHEAFAAQVLSNTQALASQAFAEKKLNRSKAIGEIDMDRLNITGGSIALGHPFAATGVRQLVQLMRDLKRKGGGIGLCTACAAGGLGAAMIVEVAE